MLLRTLYSSRAMLWVAPYMHACHDSCWGNELVPSPGSVLECMGEVKPWTALKHRWEVMRFWCVRTVC